MIGLASLLTAAPTLGVRQTGATHKITVFAMNDCLERFPPDPDVPTQFKSQNVRYGQCYDAVDANYFLSWFLSAESVALAGSFQPPASDNVICETRVYFQPNCEGDPALTDNYSGKCVNARLNVPDQLADRAGLSIRVDCCKGAADGKSCLYVPKYMEG